MPARANLVEIFSSVQGEGPDVGAATLFLRFGGCDLRCSWCDSPHTWRPARHCRIEQHPGAGDFRQAPNPLPLDDALAAARALHPGSHRFASLTGGEPLLQPAAAKHLARALRADGLALHLETHGLHADALAEVLPHLDVVSMDWKLASDVRRAAAPEDSSAPGAPGDSQFHEAHRRFLSVARAAPRVVVKLVISAASREDEICAACDGVAETHPQSCVVLQPVTPFAGVQPPAAARVLELQRLAAARLPDVRVIPQTHKLWGAH